MRINMSNFFIGTSLGIMFTVAVLFTFKENTVIYKEGYAQCMIDKENGPQ